MITHTNQEHNFYGNPIKYNGDWYLPEYERNEDGGTDVYPAVKIDDASYIAWLEGQEVANAKFQRECESIISTMDKIRKSEQKAFSEIRSTLKDAQEKLGRVA
jgi:hypothetical protein